MHEPLAGLRAIVWLPLGIIAAWVLGEWRRRRRLEAFADPRLLGISRRWPPRILAATLFAGALTTTAAIALAPPGEHEEASASPGACALLLDGPSVGGRPGAWETAREQVERAVEDVISEGEGMRFSVHAAEGALRLIVPETYDRKGILLMLQGFLPDGGTAVPGTLRRCVEMLCEREHAPVSRPKVVIISARTSEELAGELQAPVACRILVFRLAKGAEPAEFAAIGTEGMRSWSSDPAIVRRFLAERENLPPGVGQPSAVPRLAGLALILVAAERMLTLLAPLYMNR